MFDLVSPWQLYRAQWHSLNDEKTALAARLTAQFFVYGIALLVLIVGLAVTHFGEQSFVMRSPSVVVSAAALLSGGQLAALTHLSTLRQRISPQDRHDSDVVENFSTRVDQVVIHLLAGTYASAVFCFFTVVSVNLASTSAGYLDGWPAAVTGALGTYVCATFLVSLPRVFVAYSNFHAVAPSLSGYSTRGLHKLK